MIPAGRACLPGPAENSAGIPAPQGRVSAVNSAPNAGTLSDGLPSRVEVQSIHRADLLYSIISIVSDRGAVSCRRCYNLDR